VGRIADRHSITGIGLLRWAVLAALAVGATTSLAYGQPQQIRFVPMGGEALQFSFFRAIHQDRQGFLWFGTERGLYRHDGYQFTAFRHDPDDPASIPSTIAYDLAEEPDGTLWIAADRKGLIRYDPHADRFTPIPPPGGQRLHHVAVDSSGTVWAGASTRGLLALDAAASHLRLATARLPGADTLVVRDLHVDVHGTLWISTTQGVLRRTPDDALARVRLPDGTAAPLTAGALRSDHRGTLHFAADGVLYRLPPGADRPRRLLDPAQQRRLDRLGTLSRWHLDRRGVLWCTMQKTPGLHALDLRTGRLTTYRHRPGDSFSLPDDDVHRIFEDRSGVLWFATMAGLRKVVPRWSAFQVHPFRPRPPPPTLALHEDRSGTLLAASFCDDLLRLDESPDATRPRWTPLADAYPALDAVLPECIMAIYDDGRALWLGGWRFGAETEGGLYRLNHRTGALTHYRPDPNDPHSLSSGSIRTILEDRRGHLWIGTEKGLDRFDPVAGRFVHYRHDPDDPHSLSSNVIWDLLEDDDGGLWVGTYGGGLNRLDPATGRFTQYRHDPSDPHSLSSPIVTTLHASRRQSGILWVGTFDGGLNRLDVDQERFERLTQRDGLPSNYVKSLLEDDAGTLWVGTDNGLARLDPRTSTLQTYTEADGLPRDFSLDDAVRRHDGTLAFGTTGAVLFHPDSVSARTYAPPLALTAFRVFDRAMPLPTDDRPVRLPWRDNFFAFEFAALDFAAPERIQYAYRLDGFDDAWIESGTRRYAAYTNLDPGRYTFRVRATNSNGVWSPRELAIPLNIVPPFWMTTWFRVLSGLVLLGGLVGGVRYLSTRALRRQVRRLEVQQQIQHERERISRDLHDHVGAQLSNIISLVELIHLSKRGDAPDRTDDYLAALDGGAHRTMAQLRETIWALENEAIRAGDFVDRVARFGREQTAHAPPTIEATLDGDAAHPLTPVQALHLYRIAQEAITNARKHADARRITVTLTARPDAPLALTIRDDGTFQETPDAACAEVALDGHGLRNMQRRAEELDGRFTLSRAPGGGTQVRVTVPT
jgi:signal transduction histidine kinase/streptogramin lyase